MHSLRGFFNWFLKTILWGSLLLNGSKYIVPQTWSKRYSKFCLRQSYFTLRKIVLTKPSWVLMVNARKPFMKHIWYGIVFNTKDEYERLGNVDFINIQNSQLLQPFSCSSNGLTIYYSNFLFFSRIIFFFFFFFWDLYYVYFPIISFRNLRMYV